MSPSHSQSVCRRPGGTQSSAIRHLIAWRWDEVVVLCFCSYLCHEFEMKGGRRSYLMGERIR